MGALVLTIPDGSNYYPDVNSPIGTTTILNGTQFQVSDMTIDQIKAAIGESSDDLGVLSESPKINMNALFRPDKNAPHNSDEWAGYNHNARPSTHYPVYGFNTAYNLAKDNLYKFTIQVTLTRGERLPINNNNSALYWNNVRVKCVISDTANNRSFTVYSPVQTVTKDVTTFNITYTDSIRNDVSGTVAISAEYVDSTGNVVYAQIEDVHPGATLIVSGFYTPLNLADFNFSYGDTQVRLYYVKATTSTFYYTPLSYSNPAGYAIWMHNTHCQIGDNHMYGKYGLGNGILFPEYYNGDSSIPFWFAGFLMNGICYKYSKQIYNGGDIVDSGYKVDPQIDNMYRLELLGSISGWPTTYP